MNFERNTGNKIVDLSFELGLDIIRFVQKLKAAQQYEIAKQLIRAGTSVGANINEAQSAESSSDFLHKLKIADKELNETAYWLRLCKFTDFLPYDDTLEKRVNDVHFVLSAIMAKLKLPKVDKDNLPF